MKNWKKMSTHGGIVAAIFTLTTVLNLYPVSLVKAQEEKPKQETVKKKETRKKYELETITVTAPGKRKEDLQKVPASETYFSDIELEDAGIENTYDLVKFSPNLHIRHNTVHHSVIIRGVTSFYPSLQSGVRLDEWVHPAAKQYYYSPGSKKQSKSEH